MNPSNATDTERALASLAERKTEIAAELAKAVRAAVARSDTEHPAFHGCIDWHSAVHGTWALCAHMRMTGDRQDEALIAAALTPEKIAAERASLRARPEFEMPYGRAWFLRLAVEHNGAFAGDETLRPTADDVLASMLGYYRQVGPDPNRGSYASDSWALINMHDYARWTGDAAALARVRGLATAHFVRHAGMCDYAPETGHFMSVGTNRAWLASKVLDGDAFDAWAERFFAASGMPRPVTSPLNWHHHGLNFSRAWGLARIAAASRPAAARQAYLAAYVAHFSETYATPRLWRGSYRGVGHWVPQFGMLALQPLFESDIAEPHRPAQYG